MSGVAGQAAAATPAVVSAHAVESAGGSGVSGGSSASNIHPPPAGSRGGGAGPLQLTQLCHAVVAPGIQERLRITVRDVHLHAAPHGGAAAAAPPDLKELRCKAYVGPLSAVTDGPEGRLDKGRLREVKLDVSSGVAIAEIDIGIPYPQEPWALRVKFYYRHAAALFTQEKVAETVEVIPRPASRSPLSPVGSANIEVLRLVPRSAHGALRAAAGSVLGRAIELGVEPEDVEDLCVGARELGPDTLLEPAAAEALSRAAALGKVDIVQRLLKAGVPATLGSAKAAETVGTPEAIRLACDLFQRSAPRDGRPLLELALAEGLPLVGERLLDDRPELLNELPPRNGEEAAKAYAAGAWSVLAAMLSRGDEPPLEIRALLDYALRVGHVRLARACLARSEGMEHMQTAIHTCLDNGRTEIVREALEAQWRSRIHKWSDADDDRAGPALLSLECGPADEPAECGVCFEPLFQRPGVFLAEGSGIRACQHFCCLDCAEHVQDEAADRLRIWRARRDPRIPQPPGPVCPLCRASFSTAARLTDPTVDPRSFFQHACVPTPGEAALHELNLCEKSALGALSALLPINAMSFAPRLEKELWPRWCADSAEACGHEVRETLSEADFLIPGGMLAWLCDHLLELKVEGQRGSAPPLHECPSRWFKFFDYDGKGVLTKPEVLRGIAKAYNVAVLAAPQTPARRARTVGVQRLREIVDGIWDEVRWKDGVPLSDFEGPGGLAERILAKLPEQKAPRSSAEGDEEEKEEEGGDDEAVRGAVPSGGLSVQEALDRARAEDLKVREEDQLRAQERAEKQRQAAAAMPLGSRSGLRGRGAVGRAGRGPGQAGAELLLASLLEAARDGSRGATPAAIRIQCPFCTAINAARAAPGHRIICGGCRSVFSVPAAAAAAALAAPQVQARPVASPAAPGSGYGGAPPPGR